MIIMPVAKTKSSSKTKQLKNTSRIDWRLWSLRLIQLTSISIMFLFLPSQNLYSFRAWTEDDKPRIPLVPPTPVPYPTNSHKSLPPIVTAEGIVIVDVPSQITIYEKNQDEKLFPASTTKIMTALVSIQEYALDEIVTVKTVITEGQVMGLVSGETITVENLLYGILVHSANDAAYALAEHHRSGVDGFVTRMNEIGKLLKLSNTHYTNPIGFDDPNHYTSVKDLAILSLNLLKNPLLEKIAGTAQITVSDTLFVRFHALKSINELLGKVPGVSGLKTGWTEHAGQSLVTTVQRNGHKVLFVILKSSDRFGETEQLINWAFTNFEWITFGPEISKP